MLLENYEEYERRARNGRFISKTHYVPVLIKQGKTIEATNYTKENIRFGYLYFEMKQQKGTELAEGDPRQVWLLMTRML